MREIQMMSKHSSTIEESFQQRIEPLLDRSAAYAYAIVHHREDAEDVLQEAALKGFLAFENYDPSRPFKVWWFVIIRNCCRDLVRGRRPRGSSIAIEPSDPAISRKSHVDQQDEMRFALGKLSDTHREILELRYFGDCSYREIAAVLSIPEGTVMSRLYAARQALAAIYKRRAE
jgi:RNA polymerase sigma-70 factor (ECF subfamily)